MFTLEKLERMIPTVVITRFEISQGNLLLGLDRLGTHVTENKIGNIRSLVHQDEKVGKLIHVASKNDFIKTISKANEKKRKKRLDQGRVTLSTGYQDIDFGGTAEEISQLLLNEISYILGKPNSIDMKTFTNKLEKFIEQCPYNPKFHIL